MPMPIQNFKPQFQQVKHRWLRRWRLAISEFLQKRDEAGAEYAMAIHMRHAMDEMGLEK